MRPTGTPRVLIVSPVLPFPGASGQQMRVRNIIRSLVGDFDVTFLTVAEQKQKQAIREQLKDLVHDSVVLAPKHRNSTLLHRCHQVAARAYAVTTGLKPSNYEIGIIDFAPQRILNQLKNRDFDIVLFEYWHTYRLAEAFRARNTICVLDMHNILWKAYGDRFSTRVPRFWRRRCVAQYRRREEAAWIEYDALITINAAEHEYVAARLPGKSLILAPMGIDLDEWCYAWTPTTPPRIAYYGGLGSPHNEQSALRCYTHLMPAIWRAYPNAELWLIGSNPSPTIRSLADDPRVRVTGFVKDVQKVLRSVSIVLCPWTGTYGFRSRIVEVMAVGVPVITTPDAVYGMNLMDGQGIFMVDSDQAMADKCVTLLAERDVLRKQSLAARRQIEQRYAYEVTYCDLARHLRSLVGRANIECQNGCAS
jgi:glycosyltransferase involved in cell wall biosynthesis